MRTTYKIDEHTTAEIQSFRSNFYISIFVDGDYDSGLFKFYDLEEAERILKCLYPTAVKVS